MKDTTAQACFIVILAATALSCSTTKKTNYAAAPNVIWQVSPVKIDGDNEDWNIPYQFMDDKANIQFSFSNDKDNLYVTMKTSDRSTQMKVLNAGMAVWIDKEGKKNKNTSIVFPLENTQPVNPALERNGSASPDNKEAGSARLKPLINGIRDYSLQGFGHCNGGYMISQENSCSIETRIGINASDELVWEAVVPFKSFYKPSLDKTDLGKTITVCFEIHALKRPDMPSGSSEGRMGGMPPGGGNGRRPPGGGGGMPPGGGGPMDGNREDRMKLFEPTSTWAKIHLAYNGE